MATHIYSVAEMSPHTDVGDIHKRALIHGYTGISIGLKDDADGQEYSITINEADTKATVKSSIDAAIVPTLSLDTTDLQVAGDGVATGTITVTDSRGASAQGETVELTPAQAMALSSISLTLNASGQATVTFGPSASSGIKSPKMGLTFQLQGGIANPVVATCQYT